MDAPSTDHIRVGLRFKRSELPKLRAFASMCGAHGQDPGLYVQAADALELDEPLILLCEGKDEAHKVAAAFVMNGFERPTIDELNG